MHFSPKFVRKYMRLAREIGTDQNPCYSGRRIGCVAVHPDGNYVRGVGYNGPPAGTPHCLDPEYLRLVAWPQLTVEQRLYSLVKLSSDVPGGSLFSAERDQYADLASRCGQCPRRLAGIPSGEGLNVCSCAHAEANCLINAKQSLVGAYLFCWCPLPCWDCAKLVINARIAGVHHLNESDYHPYSRFLFEKAGVKMLAHDPKEFD